MTKQTRTLLTTFSWLAFLVAAPVVLRYSLGHRVTPQLTESGPVGTFLIRTLPRGAQVFLHGADTGSKTPTTIRSLTPGTYAVRLTKEGYRPWEKRLEILGMKVTDVRHVRLIPEKIEEDIARGGVLDFSISGNERWLALIEEAQTGARLRIVPLERFTDEGVIANLLFEKQEQISFRWSPDGDHAAVTTERGPTRRFAVLNALTGHTTPLESVDDVLGWTPDATGRLLVRVGTTIRTQATADGENPHILSRSAFAASVSSGGIAVAEADDLETPPSEDRRAALRLFSQAESLRETLPAPPLAGESVGTITVSPAGDVAMLTQPKQTLFLWDRQDRVWREVTRHAENLQWSPDGEKLLWQESEFDVWVMNIHEERSVLPRLAPELVVRLSRPTRHVRWFAGSQHVLFLEGDILRLAEIDGRDGHRMESLLGTNRGDGGAEVVDQGRVMFATARRDGAPVLMRIFLRTPEDR